MLAKLPPPNTQLLAWVENSTAIEGSKPSNMVSVDIATVVRGMLCMGSELAAVYLHALKNNVACRNCCADVMNKIATLLQSLGTKISDDDLHHNNAASSVGAEDNGVSTSWRWVSMEHKLVRELIALKNAADQQFKAQNFKSAIHSYTSALKVRKLLPSICVC